MPGKYEHRYLALVVVAGGGFFVFDDLSQTTGCKEGDPLAK